MYNSVCACPGTVLPIVFSIQGALLLSEVLRERDAQVEYKKQREERMKQLDQSFLQWQQEVCTP